MRKEISIVLSLILLLSSLFGIIVTTASAQVQYITEGTVEFENNTDIVKAYSAKNKIKPTVENGRLSIASEVVNNAPVEKRVTLPIKLEPNTEYIYSVKYCVDKEIEKNPGKATLLQLFGCKEDSNCSKGSAALATLLNWQQVMNTDYAEFTGSFKTGDLGEYNILGINMQSANDQIFYIDSITVKKFVSEGTFNFENSADIAGSYSAQNKTKPSVKNGELIILSEVNPYPVEKRVTLPVKLESNTEYTYSVRYRVDKEIEKDPGKATLLQLFACKNDTSCSKDSAALVTLLNWQQAMNTDYKEFNGTFKTGDLGEYNIFGIVMNSSNDQLFCFDTVQIKKNAERGEPVFVSEGKFEFDSISDIAASYSAQGKTKPTVKNGELTMLSEVNPYPVEKRVTLPIILESNTEYSYSIKYRVDKEIEKDPGKATLLQLFACKNDTDCTKSSSAIVTLLNWQQAMNTDYKEFNGNFTTGDLGEYNIFGIIMNSANDQMFYFDTVEVKKIGKHIEPVIVGEGKFEFDSNADILNSFSAQNLTVPAVKDGELTMLSQVNPWPVEKRVSLPVKLESSTEYEYSVRFRVDKEIEKDPGKATLLQLFACKNDKSCSKSAEAIATLLNWEQAMNTDYKEFKGTFITGDLGDYNIFSMVMSSANDQMFLFDCVEIKKMGKYIKPVIVSEGKFEFENNSDLLNSFSAQGLVKPSVKNGELTILSQVNPYPVEKRVSLPVKLESNTDYSYTIKYRVDKEIEKDPGKATLLQLYGCKNDSECSKGKSAIVTLLNWQQVFNTEYKEFKGFFTTGNLEDYNILSLVMSSANDQLFYFDSIEIKVAGVKDFKAIDKGKIDFNSSNDIVVSYGSGGAAPEVVGNTGEIRLTGEKGKRKCVTLPIELKQGRTYSYRIKYRVNFKTANGTTFNVFSASTSYHCGYDSKFRLVRHAENTALRNATAGSDEFVGNFKTDSSNITDKNKMFGIMYQSLDGQDLYIESVEIDWETTEKVPLINNFGKLNFNNYNQIDLAYTLGGSGAAIVKDGNRKVLALAGRATVRLPVKVDKNKKIAYIMKAKIIDNKDSKWFYRGTYFCFYLGDGSTTDPNKIVDLKNNDAKLNIMYNFSKLEPTENYEEIRGRVGITKNAGDGMNYLCLQYQGDSAIYIDEIELRDFSNDIFGDPIDDTTWELPKEDASGFTLWKSWLSDAKRVLPGDATDKSGAVTDADGKKENSFAKEIISGVKSNPWLAVGIAAVIVVVIGGTVIIIVLKKRKTKSANYK